MIHWYIFKPMTKDIWGLRIKHCLTLGLWTSINAEKIPYLIVSVLINKRIFLRWWGRWCWCRQSFWAADLFFEPMGLFLSGIYNNSIWACYNHNFLWHLFNIMIEIWLNPLTMRDCKSIIISAEFPGGYSKSSDSSSGGSMGKITFSPRAHDSLS